MRENEFRAWDKKLKKMWEPVKLRDLIANLGCFGNDFNATAWTSIKDHLKDVEWLEYTGLKDKNLRKIFEFDRVEVEYLSGGQFNHFIKGTVKMIDGCWDVEFDSTQYDKELKTGKTRHYLKCYTVNHGVEIIGNIYENPEVLKP